MYDENNDVSNNTIVDQFNFSESQFDKEEVHIDELGNNFLTPVQVINNNLNLHKNLINMAHINAVSIPKHKAEIQRSINDTNLDILAVIETNIKDNTPNDVFFNEWI